MNWKTKIEFSLESFSDIVFKHRLKTIFIILTMVATLASQLQYVTFDTSTEGFLEKDSKEIMLYDKFRNQFGKDEKVLIAIESKNVFTIDFLNKLNNLHTKLEKEVPYITGVNSIINARLTTGDGDSLIVNDVLEKIPTTKEELQKAKQIINSSTLFRDLLISRDGTMTSIILDLQTYSSLGQVDTKEENIDEFDDEFSDTPIKDDKPKQYLTDIENNILVAKVKEITSEYENDNFRIYIAGGSTVTSDIKQSMQEDMSKFIKLLLVVVVVFLVILFRRVSGVVMPMFVVLLSLISTISIMSAFGVPITMVTQILPSFLLAVMIGASVHLLSIFYRKFDITKDKKEAIRYAIGHSGLAIIMTSFTTAVGLLSFATSDLAPVASFGVFVSIGIMLGLIFTLVLMPALISLFPIKNKNTTAKEHGALDIVDRMLVNIAHFSTKYPNKIIAFSAVFILVTLALSTQLRFSHNPIHWFSETNPIRVAVDKIDDKMKGSSTFEIVIDTHKENGLYDPKLLQAMDRLSKDIATIKSDKYYVGKVMSIVDIVKESNKALNENKQEFYTIPNSRGLVAQELLLFENSSDDLTDFVDPNFTLARMSVKVPNIDAIYYLDMIDELEVLIQQHLGEFKNVSTYSTGISRLLSQIMTSSIYSSAFSYALALIFITLIMIGLLGNLKLGLISMIPNISPILVMSAIMFMFNMPLDMFAMLIGAIAIGIAVDDTVHFMHIFRKYELEYGDVDKAVEHTLLTTGKAMVITSIVLNAGFLVFLGSHMNSLFNFGILTSSAITVALIADLFLLPALMKVVIKKKSDIE